MTGYSRPPRRFNSPRQKPSEAYGDHSDSGVIRGAALKNHFPVYQPSTLPRLLPAEQPLEVHFNPKTANRQMGAGHYNFDLVGQARLDQQKELKKTHEETKRVRQELGVESRRVEGMVAPAGPSSKTTARMNSTRLKRKAEVDERRDMIKAKKMKKMAMAANDAPGNASDA